MTRDMSDRGNSNNALLESPGVFANTLQHGRRAFAAQLTNQTQGG